VQTEVVVEV